MKSILKNLFLLLTNEQKKKIPRIILMMLFGAVLETFSISMMVPLVSIILDTSENSNGIVAIIRSLIGVYSDKKIIVCMFIIIALFFISKNLFLYLQIRIQANFAGEIRESLQKKMYKRCMIQSYEHFLAIHTGDVQRNIVNDATGVFNALQSFMQVAMEGIIAVGLLIALMIINPLITIASAILIATTIFIIYRRIGGEIVREGDIYTNHMGALNQWIMQSIDAIKEIKVLRREAHFKKNFDILSHEFSQAHSDYMIVGQIPRLGVEAITISGVMIILGGYFAFGLDTTDMLAQLSAFALAAVRLLPSMNRMTAGINMIRYSGPQIVHVQDALSMDTGVENIPHIALPDLRQCLELKNVSYRYPDADSNVLDGIDIKIKAGQTVGIIGESGAGKTTFVNIMLGLLGCVDGDIFWDGQKINVLDTKYELNMGYIPQQISLLDASIKDNIIFGSEKDDEKKLMESIRESQLEDVVISLQNGVHTKIGEKGIRLSGGQRQRIGIARALYNNPSLLVLDEATAALDNETERELMKAVNGLRGKKTMIIIAHRLSTLNGCDAIYKMENGKLIYHEL